MRLLLLGVLFFVTTVTQAGEAERVFNQVRGSMVIVTILDERNEPEGEGSGVVISDGRIITNCHVVREAAAIQVAWADQTLSATLELEDTERDLCRLQVKNLNAKSIKIRSVNDVAPGEAVFAIGNPLGLGLSVSSGIVSAVKDYQGQRLVFSSSPIAPGSSGGGLFDSEGRLIAITSAMLSRGQNFNLSVPADGVAELVSRGKTPKVAPDPGPDPDWFGQAEVLRPSGQWIELEEWARKWGSTYPTSSLADGYLGFALYKMGQLDRSQKVLLNATRDPGNASARAYLAMTLHDMGETQQANKFLKKAMQLDPRAGFYWLVQAEWHMKAHEYAAMLESTQEVVKLEPWGDRGWALQGAALQMLGRYQEATLAYRTSLRLKPGDVIVTSSLASALALSGANTDARQVLAGASKELVNDASSWIVLGLDEENKKNIAQAERAYRKALELNPKAEQAWHRLGIVLMTSGRSQEAEKAIRKVLELKPDAADVMADLAEILNARGEKTERKALLEKAYAQVPSSSRLSFSVAILRQEMHDYAGMVVPLQTVAQAVPKNAQVWSLLGDALVRTGRPEEGFKALKTAQEIDPKNPVTLSALSTYYGSRGEHAEALSFAEQSLAINGADSYSWSNKGYSLLKLGRFADATQALETAVRLQPDLAGAWINLGEAYFRLGQLGKSIQILERSITLAPSAADAKSYLIQAYMASRQPGKAKPYAEALVQQFPRNPGGWYFLIDISLALNNRNDALEAYDKLKRLNPAAARDLREKTRGRLPAGFELPQ
jgi:tetratricopeptide (TPR) repeat protein